MMNSFIVLTLAATGFVATNLENFLLLIAFLANFHQSKYSVAWGYLIAIIIIITFARIISEAAEFVPDKFFGLLGLIPLTLGMWELLQILRHKINLSVSKSVPQNQPKKISSITTIMLANGGDSLAVFTSLFVDTQWHLKPLIWISVLIMTYLSFTLATWFVQLKFFNESRQRFTQMLMPFLLIVIGIYILVDSSTDTVN